MPKVLEVYFLSGAEDGRVVRLTQGKEGYTKDNEWTISIGRREDNDLRLQFDTFSSRSHAKLHWRNQAWWLEDCNSANGTFLENADDYFNDERVNPRGIVPIQEGKIFRIGRTWLRIQGVEE